MRYPAEKRARRTLVRQHDESDCGAACLASIIRFFGGYAVLERIRELSGTGAHGTTLLGLVQAGRELGLDVQGFKADMASLADLECPSILHVVRQQGFQHFVVCYGLAGDEYVVGDPAAGVYRMSGSDLDSIWSSHALLTVRPTADLVAAEEQTAAKRRWLVDAMKEDQQPLGLAAVMGLLIAGFGLTIALFSQILLDDILPDRDGLKLVVGLLLVACFLTAQNGLTAVRQMILIRQARSLNKRIIRYFLDALVRLPYRFYATRRTGDLVARLNDAERLQRVVTFVVGDVMINILMLITSLVFIFIYSGKIGIWVASGLALLGACAAISQRPILQGQRDVMAAHAANESCYVDSIRSIETVKAANAEPVFAEVMRSTFGRLQDAMYRLGRITVTYTFFAQLAGLFIMIGVLGWGAFLVLDESLGIGSFVALLQMANMLVPAAYGLAFANVELQEASVAFDRMYQYSSLKPEYPPEIPSVRPRRLQQLEASGLTFRFAGRPALLESLSFHICRGECVLLVGETGSGKSTLLRILLRLYKPETGTILINGEDWSGIPTPVWRSMTAIVPQDVGVFSGTLAENVAMGPITDTSRIEVFCESSGLADVVRGLPDGCTSLIGEGGVRLSGGQRRLLGLTRALYREPRLLLLDEVTSGLDRRTISRMIDTLRMKKPEMAMLAVSHTAAITEISDRIYVLEEGRLRAAAGAIKMTRS